MNAPGLEPSKQLDNLFIGYLRKIKFHIFHNISKCSIYGLRQFKYNNIRKLCDLTQDKYKIREIIVKKSFVLCEEFIDVFHNKFYIPTIEQLSSYIFYVSIIGSVSCGKTRNHSFYENSWENNLKLSKYYTK